MQVYGSFKDRRRKPNRPARALAYIVLLGCVLTMMIVLIACNYPW